MKKALIIALFVVMALSSVALAATPIKIGYLANLTGDAATWGVHEKNGAILAIEEINKKGGVLGRPLELVVYDVKAKAVKSQNCCKFRSGYRFTATTSG